MPILAPILAPQIFSLLQGVFMLKKTTSKFGFWTKSEGKSFKRFGSLVKEINQEKIYRTLLHAPVGITKIWQVQTMQRVN